MGVYAMMYLGGQPIIQGKSQKLSRVEMRPLGSRSWRLVEQGPVKPSKMYASLCSRFRSDGFRLGALLHEKGPCSGGTHDAAAHSSRLHVVHLHLVKVLMTLARAFGAWTVLSSGDKQPCMQ